MFTVLGGTRSNRQKWSHMLRANPVVTQLRFLGCKTRFPLPGDRRQRAKNPSSLRRLIICLILTTVLRGAMHAKKHLHSLPLCCLHTRSTHHHAFYRHHSAPAGTTHQWCLLRCRISHWWWSWQQHQTWHVDERGSVMLVSTNLCVIWEMIERHCPHYI